MPFSVGWGQSTWRCQEEGPCPSSGSQDVRARCVLLKGGHICVYPSSLVGEASVRRWDSWHRAGSQLVFLIQHGYSLVSSTLPALDGCSTHI